MRWLIAGVFLLLALVFVAASVAIGYQFGELLGTTPDTKIIYARLGAAAELMKALMPVMVFTLLSRRYYGSAMAGFAVWIVLLGFSGLAVVGYTSLNQTRAASTDAIKRELISDHRLEARRIRSQIAALPTTQPREVIQQELAVLKKLRRPNWKQRRRRGNLKTDLVTVSAAERLHARLKALTPKKTSAPASAVVAQAEQISKLVGLDYNLVLALMSVLIATMLEVCGGFGLYVALGFHSAAGSPHVRQTSLPDLCQTSATPLPDLAARRAADVRHTPPDVENTGENVRRTSGAASGDAGLARSGEVWRDSRMADAARRTYGGSGESGCHAEFEAAARHIDGGLALALPDPARPCGEAGPELEPLSLLVRSFILSCCNVEDGGEVTSADLFEALQKWSGETVAIRNMSAEIGRLGYQPKRFGNRRGYSGVVVNPEDQWRPISK